MKRLLILLTTAVVSFTAFGAMPKEGMWLPSLLEALNIDEMQSMGCELSAEDIYSVNNSSLKDAIVSFGGFCTGSMISKEGLLLTNHHCGFGQVQFHSSVEQDYLTDGFWAMDKSEELINEGLTATFIVKIDDVTNFVLEGYSTSMNEVERNELIKKNITAITEEATAGSHYSATVKSMFNGNEYYMFTTETFKDVRLVGAPPSSIGKYGGDTDNWMWPRHTGDFSLFRVYADKNNLPAEPSADNVPYRPKHHLPVSTKGVEKDDFTMVFGFPGRTQEYLSSYAVDFIMHENDPAKIDLRSARLDIINAEMKKSDKVRIQYAAKQSRIANAWKKWQGEVRGLKKLNAVAVKRAEEQAFNDWVNDNGERAEMYGNLTRRYATLYEDLAPYSMARDYLNESVFAIEAVLFAFRFNELSNLTDAEEIEAEVSRLKSRSAAFFKDYHEPIDRAIAPTMLASYYQDIAMDLQPDMLEKIESKYRGDFEKYIDYTFNKTFLTDEKRVNAFLDSYSARSAKKLKNDPIFKLMQGFINNYYFNVRPTYDELNNQKNLLDRTYIKAMREMKSDKNFYPDANSTLRIAYGKVNDYYPADGVHYHYQTTLSGIMEKAAQNIDDYDISDRLAKLYALKDYGEYAMPNGDLPICFIAANHTTGGNSGSPVINGKGELIGLNFDRTWESTMSDIMFDPDRCRNVCMDTRYILWVVDKYAEASHLVQEMSVE